MQIDRSKQPASSEEIKFTLPGIQNIFLSNGLKIFFQQKNELPIIRINFVVNNGSRFDPNDKKGLCNLLTMCIDEGAGEFNALQLADEFELLGAQFSVSSNSDVNIFSLQVLSENFIPAFRLLSAIITKPHFKDEDFNREKNKVIVRLKQSKTEPDYIADIAFEYFLFGNDSPYAFPVSGTEHSVHNIQSDSIRDMYKQNYSPSNSAMVVVGNIEEEILHKSAETFFGDWRSNSFIDNSFNTLNRKKNKLILINKSGAGQTEIRTGHLSSKRNESDYFHKQILNLILGGQFSSRLNLNLREKNGYTYGVHSQFNYLKEAGYFEVSTSVDVINTSNALKEIYSEIKKIKSGISEKELMFAKSSIIKKFPSNFETYRQIISNITNILMYNLPVDYFTTYVNKVIDISLPDVNKVAFDSIYHDELISVLVGDSSKIINELNENEFGEINVIEIDDIFKN